MNYDHRKVEARWSKWWVDEAMFRVDERQKNKSYILIEFPYPSGERLHVGHARSYSCMDAVARKRRMQGENVMFPFGWDAFGLPAENYAIKTGIHPSITTAENIANSKKQAIAWGLSFDWSREVNTTDPNYYKWTQWIFVQLFKHGLAYKAEIPVNWCPKDKINLANEEVIDGKCERCGTVTERRMQKQWLLRITRYADRLLRDLDAVNYRQDIRQQQVNWIGRKEGARVNFQIPNSKLQIEVFTTRLDTIFGATFLVLSPELAKMHLDLVQAEKKDEVNEYIKISLNKSEQDRIAEKQAKSGLDLGFKAVNPANDEEIPVFVADYVLKYVGTGAVMGVPAHDERDFDFAKMHRMPIRKVIDPVNEFQSLLIKRSVTEGFVAAVQKEGMWIQDYEDWGLKVVSNDRHKERYVELVQKHLKDGPWYVDVDGVLKAVIFKDKVFNLPDGDKQAREYARKLGVPKAQQDWQSEQVYAYCFPVLGTLVNSGKYSGMSREEAVKALIREGIGEPKVTYHLRDWVFSRQHYWGEPIPMIYCEICAKAGRSWFTTQGVIVRKATSHKPQATKKLGLGTWDLGFEAKMAGWYPVSEAELPVVLPMVEKYQPTDSGDSPLANIKDWVEVQCPECGSKARRETDTMPNWAGSSWYYLRYCDVDNDIELASKEKLKYWLPVDWYNGGMEHTTLHLLYSRFWHKFLYDIGVVPTIEPYAKRTSHGVVLGPDSRRMSKSRGNVINPDEIVEKYGADTLRLYEMFIGPFDQMVVWNDRAVAGVKRFLDRVWRLANEVMDSGRQDSDKKAASEVARLVKKIDEDLEATKFNTAVAAAMEFVNFWEDNKDLVGLDVVQDFVKALAPIAPFISEEIMFNIQCSVFNFSEKDYKSVHLMEWPTVDESLLQGETVEIVVQVNGKMRDKISMLRAECDEETTKQRAAESAKVRLWMEGKTVARIVWVPGKLVNFVTG